jgi:hypothetical protein
MNFKGKLSEIGQSILIAVFLIAITLIFVGIRCDTINWIFVTIGTAVVIPFGIVFLYQRIMSSKKKK